jgi:xanthine dehydrogenase accessory factor
VNGCKQLFEQLRSDRAVLVTVESAQGSVPRDAGTWMAVFANHTIATIGGGKLELDAIAHARAVLDGIPVPLHCTYALGPSLGQCCGGMVRLQYEPVSDTDIDVLRKRLAADYVPVALFGAGHVGLALARVLGTLPMNVHWIDSRDQIFPPDIPDTVHCDHSEPVQGAVATLPPHTRVVIMSFSHAEDLDIVAACLKRQRERTDLPYIGLIGSKTKWASFRQKLLARGYSEAELTQVTCPIGVAGIADKRPAAIAVAVAAQLLQVV